MRLRTRRCSGRTGRARACPALRRTLTISGLCRCPKIPNNKSSAERLWSYGPPDGGSPSRRPHFENRCPIFSFLVFRYSSACSLGATSQGTRSVTLIPARSSAATLSGLFDSRRTWEIPSALRISDRQRKLALVGFEPQLLVGFDRVQAASPAVRRPAAWPSGRCRGPPAARRPGRPHPRRRSCASAISSCWRQSQRSEPKTSPVRHCEWIRTSGGAECTSPITKATASSTRRV